MGHTKNWLEIWYTYLWQRHGHVTGTALDYTDLTQSLFLDFVHHSAKEFSNTLLCSLRSLTECRTLGEGNLEIDFGSKKSTAYRTKRLDRNLKPDYDTFYTLISLHRQTKTKSPITIRIQNTEIPNKIHLSCISYSKIHGEASIHVWQPSLHLRHL